ncbi:probable cytochrome P450 6d5 [Phlebotomus argentipes]|uniref:probable cytochrome P450 6d5 n=1 Tax=Phlebotomus argentipes TaxID=94469 RepID=UPI00289365A0|nr:probable cytochrome P450 6d5 [Phlebotomus argentipes]
MGISVEDYLLLVSLFFTVLVTIFYFYAKYSYSYWERNNVKSLKPSFPFGNFAPVFLAKKSFNEYIREIYESTTDDYIGLYALFRPIFVPRNSELCRNIIIKDFQFFHDRGVYADEKIDPLSGHLFSLSGEKWKNLRAKLTPTFTSGKLKAMFQTLIDCGDSLEKFLASEADCNAEVEMRDLMARYTTNIIASVAFGIEVDTIAEPNAPFRHFGRKPFAPTVWNGIRNALFLILPRVAEMIKLKTVDDDYEQFIFSMVNQTIDYREKNNINRKDFMQLLLQLRNTGKIDYGEDWNIKSNKDDVKKLSVNELAAQVHVFFLAGFETSSTTMSFCLYELARNPEIQAKVQTEIDQVLEKYQGKWSYDAIMEMKYLECCIDEALRMYPPVPLLNRECTSDYQIPGTKSIIKKGTAIFIPIAGLHYDPHHFKDPTTFQPERFSAGTQNLNACSYLPFGDGPRVCIGLRLGKMQAKIGLTIILSKFNIHLGENLKHGKIKYAPESITPTPIGGLKLRVSHRKL